MAMDQTSPEFLNTLRNAARGLMQWAMQEQSEGHHPPSPQQHQQGLQQPGGSSTDAVEPATYAFRPGSRGVNQLPQQPNRSNAAGMLLMAPDGRALFVRRAKDARDHAGEWSIPGGMSEGDEDPWATAQRETNEEVGDCGDHGNPQLLDHSVMGDVGYTTFGSKVGDAFRPVLSDEHDGYQWSGLDNAPQPLHPGLKATLDFAMDPLTEKGSKIMRSMKEQYGPEKGERVFYASRQAGKISGVDNRDSYQTTGRRDRTMHQADDPASPFLTNTDAQGFVQRPTNTMTGQNPPLQQTSRDAGQGWSSPLWGAGTVPKAQTPAAQKRPAGAAGRLALGGRDQWSSPSWIQGDQPTTAGTTPSRGGEAVPGAWGHRGALPPQQSTDQTGKFAEIEEAVSGKARDPAALAAHVRAKMIGRPALQRKAAAARREGDNAIDVEPGLAQRFKLLDTRTGQSYEIDKPLPVMFTPSTTQDEPPAEDAGGGAGGWGHQGINPPQMTDTYGGQPADQTGPDIFAQKAGEQSRMGAIHRPMTPGGVGRSMAGVSGIKQPKYTHSIKQEFSDGSIDERRYTRPGGPPMQQSQPPSQQDAGQWASPQWQQDQGRGAGGIESGWPTARTAGPSPQGGRAGMPRTGTSAVR